MKTLILSLSIFTSLFLFGCKKEHTSAEHEDKAEAKDVATAIVTHTYSSAGRHISVFNPNGSLRWEKIIPITSGTTSPMTYGEGKLFISLGGSLHAFDIQTGTQVWQQSGWFGSLGSPTFYKKMLYATDRNNFFYEIVPENGITISRLPFDESVPLSPYIKDSVAYITSATNQAFYSIHAFSLHVKSVMYSIPLGYNPPAGISSVDDFLIIRNKLSGALTAINTKTGAKQWTKTDVEYTEYVIGNGRLYAVAKTTPYSIIAFDVKTGSKVWDWKQEAPTMGIQHLYLFGKELNFQVGEVVNKVSLVSVDFSNGKLTKRRTENYRNSISNFEMVGDKVYRTETLNTPPYTNKVFVYKADDFSPVDSMEVNGVNWQGFKIIKESDH